MDQPQLKTIRERWSRTIGFSLLNVWWAIILAIFTGSAIWMIPITDGSLYVFSAVVVIVSFSTLLADVERIPQGMPRPETAGLFTRGIVILLVSLAAYTLLLLHQEFDQLPVASEVIHPVGVLAALAAAHYGYRCELVRYVVKEVD